MKKFFSKTIKLGRFTVSFFSNEIVVVFIGERKILIKTFRIKTPFAGMSRERTPRIRKHSPGLSRISILFHITMSPQRKRLAVALSAALIAIIFVFSLYPSRRSEAVVDDDEAIKNNLLQSKQTDYSSPEKSQKLVINEHRVVRGENMSKIAKKYGVSVDTIRGTNNLSSDGILREGTVLKIPNKDGILYRMQRGGELVSIARRYRVSLKKIIEENDLKNPDFVAANTVLFIPDAKPLNVFSGFIWPTGGRFVTCGYGWRRNPFDRSRTEFHQGLDIRSNYRKVRAAKYGKVTYTGWLGGYGKTVVIAHPNGYKTLYAHLSRIIVRNGQYVKQGQHVAVSGNTGRSTGAHLHFEILKNGRSINPYRFFRKKRR
ncbi:MAG: M23 family metallopeptidase [Spirochaetes bacterium]|nr:M23 family metallopeptidase [Spirochaetota bacterium]